MPCKDLDHWYKHVGHHQEQMALLCLPSRCLVEAQDEQGKAVPGLISNSSDGEESEEDKNERIAHPLVELKRPHQVHRSTGALNASMKDSFSDFSAEIGAQFKNSHYTSSVSPISYGGVGEQIQYAMESEHGDHGPVQADRS